MIEINDRVKLSDECIEHHEKTFGQELKEWGIDIRAFGEGTVIDIRPVEVETWCNRDGWQSRNTATVEWDNPQTLHFDDEPDRLCNEIAVEWLVKIA